MDKNDLFTRKAVAPAVAVIEPSPVLEPTAPIVPESYLKLSSNIHAVPVRKENQSMKSIGTLMSKFWTMPSEFQFCIIMIETADSPFIKGLPVRAIAVMAWENSGKPLPNAQRYTNEWENFSRSFGQYLKALRRSKGSLRFVKGCSGVYNIIESKVSRRIVVMK